MNNISSPIKSEKNSNVVIKNFVDFFIVKEKKFLFHISPHAYENKDFRFYIEWFLNAIYDSMNKDYDVQEHLKYWFINNLNLNIIFLTYVVSDEFISRAKKDIEEYKQIFNKEYIFE